MASKVNGHTKRAPAAAAQESIYKLVRFVIHRIFTLLHLLFPCARGLYLRGVPRAPPNPPPPQKSSTAMVALMSKGTNDHPHDLNLNLHLTLHRLRRHSSLSSLLSLDSNQVDQGRPAAGPAVARIPANAGSAGSPNKRAPLGHHSNSSQVANLMNPVTGVRDMQKRAGKTPVNHARDNLIAIKEQSSKNQLKKLEEIAAMEAKAKGGFRAQLDTGAARRAGIGATTTTADGAGGVGGRGPASPGGAQGDAAYGMDFVAANKVEAVSKAAARGVARLHDRDAASKKADWTAKQNYGKVPSYLRERKLELLEAQQAKRDAEENAHIPAGMRILPEDERLKTLDILRENRADVENKLRVLPFKCETPSQIRNKQSLEARLEEIEDAQKIFGRKQVYVRA